MVNKSEKVTTSQAAEKSTSAIEKEKNSITYGITHRHPSIAEMVAVAILELKERGGSSTRAIKKYLVATFKADVKRSSQYIRRYLNVALENGDLIQSKGGGAAGSFKLSEVGKRRAQKIANKVLGKTFLPSKPRGKKASPDAYQSSHPTYREMIDAAIVALDGKNGSTVFSIKKYISNTYPVNKAKHGGYIKKNIIAALESGHLVQTKGNGASASIDLSSRSKKPALEKNTLNKSTKEKKSVKPKTATAKKLGRPKNSTVASKKVSPKKTSKSLGRPSKKYPKTPARMEERPAESPDISMIIESLKTPSKEGTPSEESPTKTPDNSIHFESPKTPFYSPRKIAKQMFKTPVKTPKH